MSSSYSVTESTSFSITHAKHMAAKVATDLKRLQRLYGGVSDQRIAEFETEAIEFLKAGYLGTVGYGFCRDGNWIEPSIHYSAHDLQMATAADDDPGKIGPGADITGAVFWSYLTYSAAWDRLSEAEKGAFNEKLPLRREGAPKPGVSGHLVEDRIYSAGGRSLRRSSVRSY